MKILFIIDVQPVFLTKWYLKKLPSKIHSHLLKNQYDYVFSFGFINYANSPFERFWHWKKAQPNSIESKLYKNLIDQSNFVLWKSNFSCLNKELLTRLSEINFNKNNDQIFICGMDSDVCVLSTTMDLFINNYDVYIWRNLCGSDRGIKYHISGINCLKHVLGNKKILTSK